MAVASPTIERFLHMRVCTDRSSDRSSKKRPAMKHKFQLRFALVMLASASVFTIGAFAQTTDEGTGPTEQPSAPMEIGQQTPPNVQSSDIGPNGQPVGQTNDPQANASQPSDAQPTEAQPGGPSGEAPAKTDLGVGRISMIHGDVSTQRGDSGDWSAATLNQPVMGGDKLSTGDNSRAEVQFDFANIFRLGANSKANIATLTHRDIQIQLSQGIANYTVSKDSEAEPEIDTPNVSVHPAHHDGVFRIEVQPDGDTLVIVRKGEAQIATPQGSAEVNAGEMATVRGDSNSAQYKISNAPDPDAWDRWNSDRDYMIRNAQAWQHTNHYYTGAEDLAANGRWQNVPDYGDVWVPNEPDGWVPYRDGNWTYEPYYGWTWVGYEPWGWAPYHYGRWFPYGGGWAWWPGPASGWYRPFWAPAYVSFWGWGGGFGFGVGWGGWGGFGWLPIGPGDWFHPWWVGYAGRFGWAGRGFGYDRFGGFAPLHAGTRFSNIANLHDPHVSGGLSTVGAGRFGAGRVTAMAATHEQLSGAHMMAGNLPVVPSRASLSASGRPAAPSTVRNGGSEHFFGAVHNNVAHPESFDRQTASLRQTMQQNHVSGFSAGGRSLGESGAVSARSTGGAGSMGSSMGKPNAGTFSGRDSSANRGGFSNSASSSVNRGVDRATTDRPFTPPANSARSSPNTGMNSERAGSSVSSGSREGFRPFTPPPSSSASSGARGSSGSGSYWSRTVPTTSEARGYGSAGYGSGSYGGGRPQLDMRQPIARSPYAGGRSPAPSYGGHTTAPSYGGSHSGGSGHVSAPSGGHSSGGGGGHSGGGHH